MSYGGEPYAIGQVRLVPLGCEDDAVGEIEAELALREVEAGGDLYSLDEVLAVEAPGQ
jgi:hypothetical protein